MNILGINGLGVVPSACLLKDGNLIAFAEEERFTRQKGSFGLMPARATKFCLEFGGLSLNDIDFVAFGWDAPKYRFKMPMTILGQYFSSSPKIQSSANVFKVAEELIKYQPANVIRHLTDAFNEAGIKGDLPPLKFIPHHLSHAASTYLTSGFDSAFILVIDGSGENHCTSIFKAEGTTITNVKNYDIPNSIGWFYQSITEYLGFMPNRHEGKVMALAAYGEPDSAIRDNLKKMLSYVSDGNYKYYPKYSISGTHKTGRIYSEEMVALLGEPRFHGEPITQRHKNIAYAAQLMIEEVVSGMVQSISTMEGYKGNLCIAGGVGLNCKMNGVVAQMPCVDNLFVPPMSNDAGTALGAAMVLSNRKGCPSAFHMKHAYYGPQFNRQYIKDLLTRTGVRFSEEPEIERTAAELLAKNKIMGWFQGRMEVGSRALGGRSILANPIHPDMRDIINEKVKGREQWRPFAASILEEKKHDYVTTHQPSPFMTLAFGVTPEMAKHIPSAVHIDNTTRPQFVTQEANPRYWRLIQEFGKITGIYALLNTSLNTNEEPIVCTPEQALKSFYASGMDYLVIDTFLICK